MQVTNDTNLTINVTTSILFVVNEESQSAAVFDFKSNLSAVVNSKIIIIIDYESSSGVSLRNTQNFNESLTKLDCLKQVFENGEHSGTPFNLSSPSPEILQQVAQILNSLGSEYSSSEALENLQKLSQTISDILRNSQNLSNFHANYRGSLQHLIGILQGLYCFFRGFSRPINFPIDFTRLLSQFSGFDVLNNLLEQIAPHVNIGELLRNRYNSPESFIFLVNFLGGNSSQGLNGLIHVLSQIMNFNQNQSSIEELVTTILEYSSYNSNKDLAQQLSSAIQNLQNTFQRLNLSNSFPNLSQLFQNNNNQLSRVITILLHFDYQNPINSIVAILLSMQRRVSPEESVPELFQQLIFRLNSSNGRQCVSTIFPNLNITNLNNSDGLENLILVRFHIQDIILQGIENFWSNMAKFWSHIPIIGRIFEAIDRAIALFTNGALHFNKLLESQVARPRVERILEILRRIANRANRSESGNVLENFIRPIGDKNKKENKKHQNWKGNIIKN